MWSMGMVVALALAAPSAKELSGCTTALGKLKSAEPGKLDIAASEQRAAVIQACAPVFSEGLKGTWLATRHTRPADAAPILARGAREEVRGPFGGKNVCERTRSTADLAICGAEEQAVRALEDADTSAQWRTLFGRMLTLELGAARAPAIERAFADKWTLLFPVPAEPVAAPPEAVRVQGTIDRVALEATLAKLEPAVRKCLPKPTDEFSVRLIIFPGGRVSQVEVAVPADQAVRSCVQGTLRPEKFPSPRAGVGIVTWAPGKG